jgi:hypothetical protein
MRILRWLIPFFCWTCVAWQPPTGFVQAVDFPYHSFPRQYWERELVWMKNIGLDAISITPAKGWTEAETAPLIRILRRLGMTIYLRLQPGGPGEAELNSVLATQMREHGGPVVLGLPRPAARVSLLAPNAMQLARAAIAARGSLVWTDVEDTRDRTGFRRGAVSFTGEEQPATAVLRRNASLLEFWSKLLPALRGTKLQAKIESMELTSPHGGYGALILVNNGESDWTGDSTVLFSLSNQRLTIPNIHVRKGDSLVLPLDIPLSDQQFCRNCQGLSKNDLIVYATEELTTAEYENGILAMEFSAPSGGEAILQLTREPTGPFLAGGKPAKFDWDPATMRARLTIPAGKAPYFRTRIGIALDLPEASAFFVDSKPLVIGQSNTVVTSYSSEEIAQRSRLVLPPNLKAQKLDAKPGDSPLQIVYRIDVPSDMVHGDHVQLALEADGTQMGHVRVQVLRPVSLRFPQSIALDYGADRELPADPAVIPVESPAGRSIDVRVRNNSAEIRTFTLDARCDGIDLLPAHDEISIGGSMDRTVPLRVFTNQSAPGLHDCQFRLSGAASLETSARIVVIPRDKTIAYSVDLDSDNQPEFVYENEHLRAVFSRPDGGRWLEFVWKDSNRNVLPENGIEVGKAAVELRPTEISIDASVDALQPGKYGEATLSIQHPKSAHTVVSLKR